MAYPKKLIDINLDDNLTEMEWEQLLGKVEQRAEDVSKEEPVQVRGPSNHSRPPLPTDRPLTSDPASYIGHSNFYEQYQNYISQFGTPAVPAEEEEDPPYDPYYDDETE